MKRDKGYTLELIDWKLSVLITENKGFSYWDNKTIHEYLEVSCDMNRDTMTVKEWHYRLLTNPKDPLARWVSNPDSYVSQEALNEARAMLEKLVGKMIPATLRKGKRHPAYKSMLQEFKSSGKCRHFKEDFTYHDILTLGRENPSRFVWILRDCGTHLLMGWNDWSKSTLDYPDKSYQCYIWDGTSLRQSSVQDCKYFLAPSLRSVR